MKESKTTNDELAVMIKKGFDGADRQFEAVNEQISVLTADPTLLQQGQEDIKLRLDNLSWLLWRKEWKRWKND